MPNFPNRLLATLSEQAFAAVQPHLRQIELVRGHVLVESGSTIERVYFPHSGIVSLVVELSVGDMVETAMVGNEGAVNAASALDGRVSLNKGIVQLAGLASSLSVDMVRRLAQELPVFQSLLIRHEQILFAQAQQSAACNASHLVEARMCRWLLRTRDLAGSDDLMITQEFLAQMLGVQRTSVSAVAGELQKKGFIRYSRGHVRVLNAAGLKDGTCECYAAVKAHYEQHLFGSR